MGAKSESSRRTSDQGLAFTYFSLLLFLVATDSG